MVMAGQLAAGGGNLLFATALASLLLPGEYADITTFLALYLLLHVPSSALSAAGALAPARLTDLRRRVAVIGLATGVGLAALAGPLGLIAGLPTSMVLALAVAAPGAGLLGVERGLAYGHERHSGLATSLVAEPCTRLLLGLALTAAVGPLGGAIGTVAGGYVALRVFVVDSARRRLPPPTGQPATALEPPRLAHRPDAMSAGIVFVLIAALQSVDLLVANRRLGSVDAARFGVLSTLGGAAAFATATVPLVLMPAAARHRAKATSTAVSLTLGVGAGLVVIGALLARPLVVHGFGEIYAPAATWLVPYLVAMAMVGLIRVLVAQHCAAGDARFALVSTACALAVEITVLLLVGHSVGAIACTTLFTTSGLATVLAFPSTVRVPVAKVRTMPAPSMMAMVGLCLAATLVRTITDRGLWVDEAISVHQAQMPFREMLADMRNTDVHPPFHHAVLWVTVRVFGTSEFAVRLPSLIAGVALVPAMQWAGRVIYDRRTGWIAAVLAAFAPFCVWYSQEARMYAQFMLFATLAVGAQVQAVRRGRRGDWVLYAVATGAMLWTQYFAVLPVAAQQLGFAWALWRRRGQRDQARRLALGWLASTAIIAIICLPLVAFLRQQFLAYTNRSDALVPGQAGAGSSNVGGTISIYAVGANLIWAIWGYHSDSAMVQIAALWPLAMLLALALLGRGRSGPSALLLALVVVPMAALFAIGSIKRDLFELRYFSGAVPAALLLGARVVTATAKRRAALVAFGMVVTSTMAVGLVDQQLNGANPRLYDFEGALSKVDQEAEPGDILLYEPAYLADVIAYYAPDLVTRPLGSPVPADATGVWVLATDRVINTTDTAAKVGDVLARLEQQQRSVVETFERPNVKVWELR